ncbi:hypothetical protein AB0K00_48530 [Dactylosporangium sp. NPDC049525]|uniref:hypothetical protein n=1 Tax=Dactylosporangium sp. NPDC049525 TaxID=3154730 RepID=UPI0034365451
MTLSTALRPSSGQRSHHDRLLRRLDWHSEAQPSGRPIDAIIVPAARRAQHLSGPVDLAGRYGATLVVLASHQCDIQEAAELVARTPGSGRAVLAHVSSGRTPMTSTPTWDDFDVRQLATSADEFRELSGDRTSNLSLKRNLGLLLARYRNWRKIMFLDDDIIDIAPEHVHRIAQHLDANRFAGLKTVHFPDNSVVCHANRLIGQPQGIFVSGAALGVNTSEGVDLQVFPDVYNEDWFAFAAEAHTAGVAHVGNVRQLEYNPFENPLRASFEEFGDLLAEGLYALFNDGYSLNRATESYWTHFIDARHQFVEDVRTLLAMYETHERVQAVKSLQESRDRLENIRPWHCGAFLDAWQHDRYRFAQASRRISRHRYAYEDAFAALGVKRWQEVRFGVVRMPTTASNSPGGARR